MNHQKKLQWLLTVGNMARTFSTCGKRQYYAAIFDRDGYLVGGGYNGAPSGFQHCKDGGCPRFQQGSAPGSNYDNCVAIHAEQNALLHTDWRACEYGTLIVNGPPCFTCAKLIANSTLAELVYTPDASYADWPQVEEFLRKAELTLTPIDT